MDSEDKFLLEKFGRKSPFKVPDGYFENLPLRVMEALPDAEASVIVPPQSFWRRHKYAVAIAACVCVLVTGVITRFCIQSSTEEQFCSNSICGSTSYSSVDDVADYLMMDNNDIYAMMSDY